MATKTAQTILSSLHEHAVLSTDQLAALCHVTKPDLQYHLKTLIANGSIASASEARVGKRSRGRPAKAYRLAQPASSNLPPILVKVIDHLVCGWQESQIEQASAGLIPDNLPPPTSLFMAVNQLLSVMTDYQPKWELHRNGPVVSFATCPFQTVNAGMNKFCQLDQLVITRITGYLAEPLAVNQRNGRSCRFRLIV